MELEMVLEMASVVEELVVVVDVEKELEVERLMEEVVAAGAV